MDASYKTYVNQYIQDLQRYVDENNLQNEVFTADFKKQFEDWRKQHCPTCGQKLKEEL